jgi:predicted  nucleic acid-binding Zn-ribbon protein
LLELQAEIDRLRCEVGELTLAKDELRDNIREVRQRLQAANAECDRLRTMFIEATVARSGYERALNASEERVAELLRENAELRDAQQDSQDKQDNQ